jgi:hypothetical protein
MRQRMNPYCTPWKRCFYCRVELRYYFKTRLICDDCDVRRLPAQVAAKGKVRTAIRAGRLPSPRALACTDCGSPADRYDHRDYGKPLQVEPVCISCNNKRGPAIWRGLGHEGMTGHLI